METLPCSKGKAIKTLGDLVSYHLIRSEQDKRGMANHLYIDITGIPDVLPLSNSGLINELELFTEETGSSSRLEPEVVQEIDPSYLESYPETNYPETIYYSTAEVMNDLRENKGIAFHWLSEKELLGEVIKLVMDYEIFEEGYEIPLEQELYFRIQHAFFEMLTSTEATYHKAKVSQQKMLDSFNSCLDFGEDFVSVMGFVNQFIPWYKDLLQERNIQFLENHMKSCL